MKTFKNLLVWSSAALALLLASHSHAAYITAEAGYRGYQVDANFRGTSGANAQFADDSNVAFVLPFAFTFYGQQYLPGSVGWISGNGLLGFDLGNADPDDAYCCDATYSQHSPANTIIAGWFDLYGDIYMQTMGAAGNREFVITWDGNEYDENGAGAPNRFQVILREASNDIEFQYAQLNAINNHYASVGGIRGDETSSGLNFIDFSQDVRLGATGLLIRYDPQAETKVPEPGSLALLGLGLAGIALLRRKRNAGL